MNCKFGLYVLRKRKNILGENVDFFRIVGIVIGLYGLRMFEKVQGLGILIVIFWGCLQREMRC